MGIGTALAIGGGISAIGSWLGAKEQRKGIEAGARSQLEAYYQARQDVAPWMEAGKTALGDVMTQLTEGGVFETSPGYQWQIEQMRGAVEGGAAGRTGVLSSGTQNQLMANAQGLAAQDYQNWLANRMGIAGMGLGAAQSTAQRSMISGQQQAGAAMSQGNVMGNLYQNLGNVGQNALLGYAMFRQPGIPPANSLRTSTPRYNRPGV